MSKKDMVSEEVFNLVGLGIDFSTELPRRKERALTKKKLKELLEERQEDNELHSDGLYCIVCGAEVNLQKLSCNGCGMEFNMDAGEARHMISLMIGIFWADGVLDENEKLCLEEYLEKVESISPQIRNELKHEVTSPRNLESITKNIVSPEGKRNTLRIAVASGMVSEWQEEELKYLEEAKKFLGVEKEEANRVMKQAQEYLEPLMAGW